MDDQTTPTPTPTKSIDGMTPGVKPPTPAASASPANVPSAPIDVNKLDGIDLAADPVMTTTDTDGSTSTPVAVSVGSATKPDETPAEPMNVPVTPAPEAPIKPSITFDAKAAEAAMAEEDSKEAPETPASLSAGGPKITSSMARKPKKKGKGVAIVIAVIIALGLIAGASYAFWKNNQDKKTEKTETVETTVSVSETVQSASDDIDSELNKIDDTKEFQATDISDTSLGL